MEKGRRIEVLCRNVGNLIIYEGTSGIHGQTIARQLLREGPYRGSVPKCAGPHYLRGHVGDQWLREGRSHEDYTSAVTS